MKLTIQVIATLLVAYILMVAIFQGITTITNNNVQHYLDTKCELIGDKTGNKWYECTKEN